MRQAATKSPFPDGVQSLFWFFFLNFLSCQIIMDSPIFLYESSRQCHYHGFDRGDDAVDGHLQFRRRPVGRWAVFIATGWTVRLLFVLGLVFVPMMDGVLNSQSQLALLIVLLFAFNGRGIAGCAWFRGFAADPGDDSWTIPDTRGAFANAGSLLAFLLVAIYLGKSPTSGRFTVLFAFSFVMGGEHRVHSACTGRGPPEEAGKQQAPWAIFAAKPFRRAL